MSESIESKTKLQFSKIFQQSDWKLFKVGANYYLRIAAKLKNDCITLEDSEITAIRSKDKRLLFRNIQKRLWLGIAGELLIKAYFLKSGYLINKPLDNNKYNNCIHQIGSIPENELKRDDTFSFDILIKSLSKFKKLLSNDQKVKVNPVITDGLKIAKVYRNKEAHVITDTHQYVENDYRQIETCMRQIYQEWFDENLEFKISFERNEEQIFKIV